MTTWIVVLSVLSIALPLWGLLELWRTARKEASALQAAPGQSEAFAKAGELNVLMTSLRNATLDRPRAAATDFVVIGVGIVAGGVANILGAF